MSSVEQLVKRQIDRMSIQARAVAEVKSKTAPALEIKPFITISRERGADGMSIAHAIAEKLGWTVLDRQLADYIAQHTQIQKKIIETVDERVQGRIENLLRGLLLGTYPDERDYARHLGQTLYIFLQHDPAVIVGRGAQILLRNFMDRGLRVHLVAPKNWRVKRLIETEKMTDIEAREEILRAQRDRAFFVKAAYDQDVSNPLLYDLTLNRELLDFQTTVQVILNAAKLKGIQ